MTWFDDLDKAKKGDIAAAKRWAVRGWKPHGVETTFVWTRAYAAEEALSQGYGALHGWVWTPHPVTAHVVRGHVYFWSTRGNEPPHADGRSSYTRAGRPIAMVQQPYTDETVLAEMRAWAGENGLTMTIPDWPSWRCPGRTTLCIFTNPKDFIL